MVDVSRKVGKKSDMNREWMLVVAGALCRDDGLWLMHRRPEGKHHAGLWEFPGGKVESAEIPVESLVRELREELGVRVSAEDCVPVTFAQDATSGSQQRVVILLYRIARWEGDPVALEGGSIAWCSPEDIDSLDKPPLDRELVSRLFA